MNLTLKILIANLNGGVNSEQRRSYGINKVLENLEMVEQNNNRSDNIIQKKND